MDVPPFVARLLGLPEDAADPTAYQLLGLDPRRFAPEQVQPALEERKRRLRQNIPGPQFIPIVSRFEQELDRVAALLLDPARRRVYDQGLHRDDAAHARRLHHRPAPPRGQSAPPTPAETEAFFATAVDLSIHAGVLSPQDESSLRALATKLGLAEQRAAAVLEQRLKANGAAREGLDLGQQRAQLEREVRALYPDGDASPVDRANLLELAAARGLPTAAAGEVLDRCFSSAPPTQEPAPEEPTGYGVESRPGRIWALIPPLAAIAVFTALVFLYAPGLLEDDEPPRTRHVAPPTTDAPTEPASAARPSPATTAPPSPRTATSPRPTTARPFPTTATRPEPATSAPPRTPTIVLPSSEAIATQLAPLRRHLKLSDTGAHHDLLADVAVITLAICDAAAHFAGQPNRWAADLAAVLRQSDRVDHLAGMVELPPPSQAVTPSGPSGGSLEQERREELVQALGSTTTGERYRAVDELRAADTADAAALLVERLTSVATTPSTGMSPRQAAFAARILRALGDMSDPSIPSRLVALIAKARNSIVPFQASRVLEHWAAARVGADTLGRVAGSYERSRTLARSHPSGEREASARAWRATLGAIEAYRVRGGSPPPLLPGALLLPRGKPGASETKPDWEPPPTPLKLLAVTEFYARHTAGLLSECTWPAEGTAPQPLGPRPPTRAIVAPTDAGQALIEAIGELVAQLNRLVREHPTARRQSLRADLIDQELRARSLASETALQRAAVGLDAAAALLEVLVEGTSDHDGVRAIAQALSRERRHAAAEAGDVAQEMREAAFYQLACWKLLLQGREGRRP